MAFKYTTSDGDTIDLIAYKHYGHTTGNVVEMLIDANPHVLHLTVLPAGLSIALPDYTQNAEEGINLWD